MTRLVHLSTLLKSGLRLTQYDFFSPKEVLLIEELLFPRLLHLAGYLRSSVFTPPLSGRTLKQCCRHVPESSLETEKLEVSVFEAGQGV